MFHESKKASERLALQRFHLKLSEQITLLVAVWAIPQNSRRNRRCVRRLD